MFGGLCLELRPAQFGEGFSRKGRPEDLAGAQNHVKLKNTWSKKEV